MKYLDKDFFKNNRQALVQKSKAGLIAIAANGLMQRNGSVPYDFQQDSNFYYLCGVNEPNMILIINSVSQEEMLIKGPQTKAGEIFDGVVDVDQATNSSGIEQVVSHKAGWGKLNKWLAEIKEVHIVNPPPSFIEGHSMYTNPARSFLLTEIKKSFAKVHDLSGVLAEMRNIKQPQEINAIKHAIKATEQTFKLIQNNMTNYHYEYEIEADMTAAFKKFTLSSPAYNSIIAGGRNAVTLHYNANNSRLDKAKPLLVDAAAQYEHYAADITRVFLPSSNTRAKEIHDAVEELQAQAMGKIKPGQSFIEYEKSMTSLYGGKLKELGLIQHSLEKHIRKFMPHATSHYLGLDVHDVGNYHQSFQPGMVLTVEPGLYLPNEEIGIRIEDNVLVTQTGVEVLSKEIPKHLSLQ